MNDKLQAAIDEVGKDFFVSKNFLSEATDKFIEEMDIGLFNYKEDREKMPMLPSFVTSVPNGKEKGLYLACDLGGTNFRVCSTLLKGDHTFELNQNKYRVPQDLMKHSTGDDLFSFLAMKVQDFLQEFHGDQIKQLKMGFTFSFPVVQLSLDRGKLLRWTKGYDLPDCVDKDIVLIFQSHLDLLAVDVKIVALANDTVGTLLSGCYQNETKVSNRNTILGAIFGTGTNGAYYETFDHNEVLDNKKFPAGCQGMVINTEWGSFDNGLKILPKTKFDQIVDSETANRGFHLFEKRISGMFLGELLRVILIDFFERGLIFVELYKKRGGTLPHRLSQCWQLNSEVLSYLQIDDSTNLRMSELVLENTLRLPTTEEERRVIQKLTQTISLRAAYLSAIPLAAIVKRVKSRYEKDSRDFELACDGAVIEFFPGFRERVLEGISLIDPLKGENKKIYIEIVKDGSGAGAALCASTTGNGD